MINFLTVFYWIWLNEYPDFLWDFTRSGLLSRGAGWCWEFVVFVVGPLLLILETNIESLLSSLFSVDTCFASKVLGFYMTLSLSLEMVTFFSSIWGESLVSTGNVLVFSSSTLHSLIFIISLVLQSSYYCSLSLSFLSDSNSDSILFNFELILP